MEDGERVAAVLSLLPRESAQSLRIAKQDSCAPNMWVLVGDLCVLRLVLEATKSSHKRFLHPAMSLILTKLTQSRTSDQDHGDTIQYHPTSTNELHQGRLPQCSKPISTRCASTLLISTTAKCLFITMQFASFLSSHALFDMHSEAACILNVCPSNIVDHLHVSHLTTWYICKVQQHSYYCNKLKGICVTICA